MKWVTCPGLIQRFIDPDAAFLAFLDKYGLTDPALRALGEVASGFREISRDDVENMALQFPVYDALYAYCRTGHA